MAWLLYKDFAWMGWGAGLAWKGAGASRRGEGANLRGKGARTGAGANRAGAGARGVGASWTIVVKMCSSLVGSWITWFISTSQ